MSRLESCDPFFLRRKWTVLNEQSTLKDVARRWAATQPTAASFISLLVSDYHDAQDILQEVAAAVLSYDFEAQGWPKVFDAWVIGIARHKVMDYYRKRGGEKLVFDTESIDRVSEAYERVGDQMPLRREAAGEVPGACAGEIAAAAGDAVSAGAGAEGHWAAGGDGGRGGAGVAAADPAGAAGVH